MNQRKRNAILLLAFIFGIGVATGTLIGVAASNLNCFTQECQTIICEDESEDVPIEKIDIEENEEIGTEEIETKIEIVTKNLGQFKLTAYCICEQCCGKWADGITATGTIATPGRTIAVDPDVIPLGSKVYIAGHEYIAEDVGGAIQNNRIDILFPSHQDALNFGVKYAEVSILKE